MLHYKADGEFINKLYNQDQINNPNITQPIFFAPQDSEKATKVNMTCSDGSTVKSNYIVSNDGEHVINIKTGNEVKIFLGHSGYKMVSLQCTKPDGDTCSRKFRMRRVVLNSFYPQENSNELAVNSINGNKNDNYVDKEMPDGTIHSNLVWSNNSESSAKACSNKPKDESTRYKLKPYVGMIRHLYNNEEFSTGQIAKCIQFIDNKDHERAVENICYNEMYTDPNYIPRKDTDNEKVCIRNYRKTLNEREKQNISKLCKDGYYDENEIQENFFPEFDLGTIKKYCNYNGEE